MKKRIYIHPTIQVLTVNSENFICLSVPIASGPGPGGGGQAKRDPFFDEEEVSDNNPWDEDN
ncbi:hypothetical protein [Segatella salivae]|uniref:Uncharacterized protein n=1 Tax=Segatella salivae F0493 TaxID=1395125 RepID=U2LFA1_9BACT|nr:hypothetical protein [Segatella salivae]ERK02976.1 hypothetical protein HMPREF9145_1562 [Segatella salivae F0493]